METAASALVEIQGLSKSFGGVVALQDVSFDIRRGEVHALCGENGAGKSTLIKVLCGVVTPNTGRVTVAGSEFEPGNVAASEAAGIAVVHQESTAFPDLNTIDNLFVGRELTRAKGVLLDRSRMRQQTEQLVSQLGESIDVSCPVRDLSLAQRQMVAIARAILLNCRLLIMDEPTASLSAKETDVLLHLVRRFRERGVSVLYVSHRLEEVFQIADRVTVLRDGRSIQTCGTHELTMPRLIQAMVGRDVALTDRATPREIAAEDTVLTVERLTRRGVFDDISFEVRRGEVVGLAGLVGAGRSEVVRSIFGVDSYDAGHVRVNGHGLRKGHVEDAIRAGVALVPEDRQHEGLVLPMSVRENLSLASLDQIQFCSFISRTAEDRLVEEQMEQLGVKAAAAFVPSATLSGGNQQKLVLGKWLARKPQVLILDEPTRGIDVGAKAQVHALIRKLALEGLAVLVISSELAEILALSDRVLVLREGRISGERLAMNTDQAELLELALPVASEHARSKNPPNGSLEDGRATR